MSLGGLRGGWKTPVTGGCRRVELLPAQLSVGETDRGKAAVRGSGRRGRTSSSAGDGARVRLTGEVLARPCVRGVVRSRLEAADDPLGHCHGKQKDEESHRSLILVIGRNGRGLEGNAKEAVGLPRGFTLGDASQRPQRFWKRPGNLPICNKQARLPELRGTPWKDRIDGQDYGFR